MASIPQNPTIPIVPDLNDLPTIVRFSHPRKAPFAVLVISAIWMMSSAFSPVWLPMLWPDLSLTTQVILTFVLTVAALGGGTLALRRHASEDEVTISEAGVSLRNFTWFGTDQKAYKWSEIDAIVQSEMASGHQALELKPNDTNEQVIPVFVARDEHKAGRVKHQLEKLKLA